jgi:hypothetical protein
MGSQTRDLPACSIVPQLLCVTAYSLCSEYYEYKNQCCIQGSKNKFVKIWVSVTVWLTGFGLMTGFIGLFDTARDYTLQFLHTHTRARTHARTLWCPQSRLHSGCLVAVSNGGRFSSSVFPNCPCPQLLASNSNSSQRLNPQQFYKCNCWHPGYNSSTRTA